MLEVPAGVTPGIHPSKKSLIFVQTFGRGIIGEGYIPQVIARTMYLTPLIPSVRM